MACSKRDYCKHGNSINRFCNSCISNYKGELSCPVGVVDKFLEGKPIKLVFFSGSNMEDMKNDFIKKGFSEHDFYKSFWEWIIEQEHFEPEVFRFDA